MPLELTPKDPPYYEIVGLGKTTITDARNGLHKEEQWVELGGSLIEHTEINGQQYTLLMYGNYAGRLLTVQSLNNSEDATAIIGIGSGGIGVEGRSTNGPCAIFGWIAPTTGHTGDIIPVMILRRSADAGTANGMGQSIEFKSETSNNTRIINSIISRLTNVTDANRTSEIEIKGVNNGVTNTVLIIDGDGKLTIKLGDGVLMHTTTNLNNGAAAQTATLLNGPTAGNPTKWIPIDDNGTTRYIPTW